MADTTITSTNLRVFNGGEGPQFASAYKIQKNSSITQVTLWLTHSTTSLMFDTSGAPWIKTVTNSGVTNTQGRRVRCAIWVDDGDWNICKTPDYLSSTVSVSPTLANKGNGVVDTDEIPQISVSNWSNAGQYTPCTFEFNTGEINATQVYIGLIGVDVPASPVADTSIAFLCDTSKPLKYVSYHGFDASKPETYARTAARCGIYAKIYTQSVLDDVGGVQPTLRLREAKYRTLSYDSTNVYDIPVPNVDKNRKIKETGNPNNSSSRVQWDTAQRGGAFALQGGFDIPESKLKDVVFCTDSDGFTSSEVVSLNSATKPFWVHSRSRIMLTFDPWNSTGNASGVSKIRYVVIGGQSTGTSSQAYTETAGRETTLLICPEDEGVTDNEQMEVIIYRQRYSINGKPVGQEASMKLVFNTFVTPSVRIAHPKPHRNKKPDGTFDTVEHNYVLWANDYLSNTTGAMQNTGHQMCDVLNMLLTKDGGDNSGYPVFTRISIMEFDCGINSSSSNSTNASISNIKTKLKDLDTKIKTSSSPRDLPECTAYYTGIQLDDGALIQLTGMVPDGLNWDYLRDQHTGIDINSDDAIHRVITKNSLVVDADGNPKETRPIYSWDWRICFRAGFKYYIRVRRFHSAVAGAIGAYKDQKADGSKFSLPSSGGSYSYNVGDNYSGAHENGNLVGYPTRDGVFYRSNSKDSDIAAGVKWLKENNRMNANKWFGPADGSTGASSINNVYPGFSPVDEVIVDCLPVLSSQSNVIVPRPANQEIGADKWATFAYRHISKNFNGVNQWVPDNPKKLNTSARNPDGTYRANGGSSGMYKNIGGYTSMWNGSANTAYRIYQMYKHLVDYTYSKIPWTTLDIPKSTLGEKGYISERRVIIRLDRQLPLSDSAFKKLYGDASSVILADFSITGNAAPTASSTIPATGYKNMLSQNFLTNWSGFNNGPNGSASAAQIFFDPYPDLSHPCYGNTYTWVPIINASKVDTKPSNTSAGKTSRLTINGKVNAGKTDTNKINAATGSYFDVKESGKPQIDTTHAIFDFNTAVTSYGHQSGGANKFEIAEYAGQLTWPGDQSGGLLYTTAGDSRSKGSSENYGMYPGVGGMISDIPTDYGKGGDQYFNTDKAQQTPGNLYQRVPVAFDCENGIPTTDRVVSPLSDIIQPIVRTSHMLYFKTYIFGRISYEVYYRYTPSHPEYDEDGNESWVLDDEENNIPKEEVTNAWVDSHAASGQFQKYATNIQNIGQTITTGKGYTFNNILTVYGEDNKGEGLCLSAADDTAVWYSPSGSNDLSVLDTGWAIEYPIKVRYTPLVQPIITLDPKIAGSGISFDKDFTKTRNVLNLERYYTKCNTSAVNNSMLWTGADDGADTSKYLTISYGMYNSAYGGRYVSTRKKDPSYSDGLYMDAKYQHLVNRTFLERSSNDSTEIPIVPDKGTEAQLRYTPGNVKSVDTTAGTSWAENNIQKSLSTDVYPSVGVCNCFTVLLFPHDAVDASGKSIDYTRMTPNWYKTPTNYLSLRSKRVKDAGVVVVADKQYTHSYTAPGNAATPMSESAMATAGLSATQIDHQLRTLYHCEFNFSKLVDTGLANGETAATTGKESSHRIQVGVDYDLVVIPIYTNDPGIAGVKTFNFRVGTNGGGYISTADTGGTNQNYGANEDDGTSTNHIDYYGSTPLVVSKFLTISSIIDMKGKKRDSNGNTSNCGGGGGGGGGGDTPDPPPEEKDDFTLYTDPAIIYPNINEQRFNTSSGAVKESPGFWLDNTFRVIMRGPHFRTRDQIKTNPSASAEVSLEEMTGKTASEISPEQYRFSDIQVHFGKYSGPVLKNTASDTLNDPPVWTATSDTFNSEEFQAELDLHTNDREWLNSHNIYSMSQNPEAFSKCTPSQEKEGDSRDVIKGGGLNHSSSYYKDRFIEFNPHIVNAGTIYTEGYYIQFRYLSSEYVDNGVIPKWSGWFSGYVNDKLKDGNSVNTYCVPVRKVSEIITDFQSFIKESYPGSNIRDKDETGTLRNGGYHSGRNLMSIPGFGTDGSISQPIDDRGNPSDTPVFPATLVTTGTNRTNTDIPYNPQIWVGNTGSEDNKSSYPINIPTSSIFWEMNYVDYIIRNMAKLYYSEWPEAYIDTNEITPQDLGWTKAMQTYYNGSVSWQGQEINPDKRGKALTSPVRNLAGLNRYYKRPILKADFEHLLNVLKSLTTFIRKEKFTGTHVKTNANVLPIDFADSQYKLDRRQVAGKTDKGFIGSNIQATPGAIGTSATDTYMAHTRTAPNYIQQLWEYITGDICS